MLLASTSIGDMLLTLSAITSLKKNDLGGAEIGTRQD